MINSSAESGKLSDPAGTGRMEGTPADSRTSLHEWLYLALICALPLEVPFNFKLSGLTVQAADLLFVGAATAWLLALLNRRTIIRRSKFYLPVIIYCVAMVASTAASVDPRRSALKLCGEFYLVGLALLTFNLIDSEAFMRRAFKAWVVGTGFTVVVGVLGVLLFYFGLRDQAINFALHIYGSLPPGNYPRIDATFLHANMLCNYLNLSLVIVLVMGALGWLTKLQFGFLCVGICVVAFFTFSPGLGGVALLIGLWLWLKSRGTAHRWRGAAALVVSVAVAALFVFLAAVTLFSHGQSGIATLGRGVEPSHRARAWQTAFETFREHPVLGRGVGMDVSNATYVNPSGGFERLTDAHNTWLSVAGEKGAVGLLAFACLLLFLGKNLTPLNLNGSSRTIIKTGFALGFVCAFLYHSLSGAFENARHLWVFFGMIAAIKEMPPGRETGSTS